MNNSKHLPNGCNYQCLQFASMCTVDLASTAVVPSLTCTLQCTKRIQTQLKALAVVFNHISVKLHRHKMTRQLKSVCFLQLCHVLKKKKNTEP